MRDKHTVHLQAFSVEDSVPWYIIDKYKKQGDTSPLFKFFTVAHEGISTGKLLGHKKTLTRYAKGVIEKMHQKMSAGVKAFLGHGKGTNDHAGRSPIGEVVQSRLEEIDGIVHHVVGIYIDPAWRDQKLDVASIEAEIQCESGKDGAYDVVDISPITGIALGDGAKDTPGFAGATLIAQLQAFTEEKTAMTKKEIIEAIKELGLSVADIFTKQELLSDALVKEIKDESSEKEFAHRKRVERLLDESKTELTTLQEKYKDHDKIVAEYTAIKAKTAKSSALEVFKTILDKNKYPEKLAKIVEDRFKDFDPGEYSDAKDLEKKVGDAISAYAEEAKRHAEMLGVKLDLAAPTVPGNDDIQVPQEIAGLANPKVNEFIPK